VENIPWYEYPDLTPDPARFAAAVEREAGSKDRTVLLICRSGNRSAVAARLLTSQSGFQTVYSVAGGINDWLRDGRPVDDCRSC